MKKIRVIVIAGILVLTTFIWAAGSFWKGETLSAAKVKARWGQQSVDLTKFKSATIEDRAAMAYNIMTDKAYVGKSVEEIRELFGITDGFYFIDTYPAYLIQERKIQKNETWQIVFRLNGKYKVRDIIVHKNCCTE